MLYRNTSITKQNIQDLDATESSLVAPAAGKRRRNANSDGMPLTKSGRISITKNEVNAKYDASYRNSDNTNKLLGRHINLGQACGIIGGVLYCPDTPLEDSGNLWHIVHI